MYQSNNKSAKKVYMEEIYTEATIAMDIDDLTNAQAMSVLKKLVDWLDKEQKIGTFADVPWEKGCEVNREYLQYTSQSKIILEKIIKHLDDLDMDDFFGTEGWRHEAGF